MKKVLCLLLAVGSMSAFSMSNRCAKASVQKEDLGVAMSVLNKNHIKYSVTKKSYSMYNIVVRAKSSTSRHIDRSVSKVIKSKMMNDMGIRFRRLDMTTCSQLAKEMDISKI